MPNRRRAIALWLLCLGLAWVTTGWALGERLLYRSLASRLVAKNQMSFVLSSDSTWPSKNSTELFREEMQHQGIVVEADDGRRSWSEPEVEPSAENEPVESGRWTCKVTVRNYVGVFAQTSTFCSYSSLSGWGERNAKVFVLVGWVNVRRADFVS